MTSSSRSGNHGCFHASDPFSAPVLDSFCPQLGVEKEHVLHCQQQHPLHVSQTQIRRGHSNSANWSSASSTSASSPRHVGDFSRRTVVLSPRRLPRTLLTCTLTVATGCRLRCGAPTNLVEQHDFHTLVLEKMGFPRHVVETKKQGRSDLDKMGCQTLRVPGLADCARERWDLKGHWPGFAGRRKPRCDAMASWEHEHRSVCRREAIEVLA